MKTITLQQLIDKDACDYQVELFKKTFGDSVEVTRELAIKYAKDFAFDWAADNLLDAPTRKIYKKTRDTAMVIYNASEATALTIYKETCAPARKLYDETCATANKIYNASEATASKIYEETCAPANKIYEETLAPARKLYYETSATAFVEAYLGME